MGIRSELLLPREPQLRIVLLEGDLERFGVARYEICCHCLGEVCGLISGECPNAKYVPSCGDLDGFRFDASHSIKDNESLLHSAV